MTIEKGQDLKENIKDSQENINWYDIDVYNGRVVNVEKIFAILMEKPYDPKYGMYAFGGCALVKKDDGTYDENYDIRCPHLSLLSISTITDVLYNNSYNDKIVFTTIEDLPIDMKLFYDTEETYKSVKDCPKIIVTFKESEIDKIYVINHTSLFQYKYTLATFKDLFAQKKAEMDRNSLIQNLFLALQRMPNKTQKTKGGVIMPS